MTSVQSAVSGRENWVQSLKPLEPLSNRTIQPIKQEPRTDLYALADDTRRNSTIGGFGNNSLVDNQPLDSARVTDFAIAAEVAETETEKTVDPELTSKDEDQGLLASLFGGFFPTVQATERRDLATA